MTPARSPFDLSGRVALVTGAARGLGAAAAAALLQAGAQVVVTDLTAAAAAAKAHELAGDGRCIGLALDVTAAADRAAALHDVEARYGRLDILVNNAGVMLRKPAVATSDAEFAQLLDVNLVAMLALSSAAFPLLAASGDGRIVNLSSIMGVVGRAGQATYVAAKHAVVGLTRALAAEFGPQRVTVNAIAPGYFHTEMNQAIATDAAFHASVVARTPLRRWGEPAEIGGAIVFLASPAAAFVTGQTLIVDGGLTVTVPGPTQFDQAQGVVA